MTPTNMHGLEALGVWLAVGLILILVVLPLFQPGHRFGGEVADGDE